MIGVEVDAIGKEEVEGLNINRLHQNPILPEHVNFVVRETTQLMIATKGLTPLQPPSSKAGNLARHIIALTLDSTAISSSNSSWTIHSGATTRLPRTDPPAKI
ncbi:hypothetical protein AMTR_s00057p00165830 [Amborella trichopoda]|uniref:Uncharacterized protein n=1 Tax=Amborella trichopoda TaxID=13333 RepID=U5CUB5_AMBTC|nr:hypothetical protein AMTR_s00057p00165830 [Amborella trichopoda]